MGINVGESTSCARNFLKTFKLASCLLSEIEDWSMFFGQESYSYNYMHVVLCTRFGLGEGGYSPRHWTEPYSIIHGELMNKSRVWT